MWTHPCATANPEFHVQIQFSWLFQYAEILKMFFLKENLLSRELVILNIKFSSLGPGAMAQWLKSSL